MSDRVVSNTIINTGRTLRANSTIATSGSVAVQATSEQVVFQAGNSVSLLPGFVAQNGSSFLATTDYGYRIVCGTLLPQAYQHPVNCYNAGAAAGRIATRENLENAPAGINVYPVPTTGIVQVKAEAALLRDATLTVHDFMGKEVGSGSVRWTRVSGGVVECNLQLLPSGMYVIRIAAPLGTVNKKVILRK